MKNQKQGIIEIAKKKRHFHLIEKLQKGKSLTRQELAELKEYENGEIVPPGHVKTREEVGKALGVSSRSVYHWIKDGMPVTKDGYFDIAAIVKWRAETKTNNQKKKLILAIMIMRTRLITGNYKLRKRMRS